MIININQYLECVDQKGKTVPYSDGMQAIKKQLGFETIEEFASSLGCRPKTMENYLYGKTELPPLMLLGKIKRMLEGKNE